MSFVPSIDAFREFSDVIPYRAITNDVIVLHSPARLCALLEMHVSHRDSVANMQAKHDRLISQLCELPADSTVSIYWTKEFLQERIPVLGSHDKEIVNFLEKKRVAHLTGIQAPRFGCYLSITVPVGGEEKEMSPVMRFVAARSKGSDENMNLDLYRRSLERLNFFIRGLIGAQEGNIYRLSSAQILEFLSLIMNHHFIENFSDFSGVFKSDFNSSSGGTLNPTNGGYVYYGGNYHGVMSLRSKAKESKLPQYSHAGLNRIFYHKDIEDIPMIVHHGIRFPSKEEGLRTAHVRKNMIGTRGAFARYMPWLAKTPEGLQPEVLQEYVAEAIDVVQNSSARFLEQHFHLHLWAESLGELEERVRSVDAAIGSVYKLKRDKFNIKPAYFSLFPGNERTNTITNMLPSFNVGDFMPIDMPRFCYPGKQSKDFIYYHTGVNSLTSIDLFDKRADNWNALIIGGSGSGKSFLCNDILWQFSVHNPQIAIVDRGGADAGSYLSFVRNNGGTYLEINWETKDFSINPFDGELFDEEGAPRAEKFTSLLGCLERMVLSNEKQTTLEADVRYHLQEAIKTYYKATDNNAGNQCNVHDFAEKHLKDNQHFRGGRRDLYKHLFPFIGFGEHEGPYARFFRKSRKEFSRDVVCFDLAGLGGQQQLKNVLVPALLDMINSDILGSGDKERKKLLVLDEAWADLKGGSRMGDFMEEMARTVRKLNGSITIISQRYEDILESEIGGALTANTSYYYFVGNKHNPDAIKQASASSSSGSITLSDYDVETITGQQSKRDFYLLTPFFSGQLRLYPCKEFAMVATTDPGDKAVLRRHMRKLGHRFVTPEVIESAKREFFDEQANG